MSSRRFDAEPDRTYFTLDYLPHENYIPPVVRLHAHEGFFRSFEKSELASRLSKQPVSLRNCRQLPPFSFDQLSYGYGIEGGVSTATIGASGLHPDWQQLSVEFPLRREDRKEEKTDEVNRVLPALSTLRSVLWWLNDGGTKLEREWGVNQIPFMGGLTLGFSPDVGQHRSFDLQAVLGFAAVCALEDTRFHATYSEYVTERMKGFARQVACKSVFPEWSLKAGQEIDSGAQCEGSIGTNGLLFLGTESGQSMSSDRITTESVDIRLASANVDWPLQQAVLLAGLITLCQVMTETNTEG